VTWTVGASEGVQTVTARTPRLAGSAVVFRARNQSLGIDGAVTFDTRLPISLIADRIPGAAGVDPDPAGATRTVPGPATGHRVVVQMRPTAAGLTIRAATDGASLSRARDAIRHSTEPLVRDGLVSRVETSPAILATRLTVAPGTDIDEVVSALRRDVRVESVTVEQPIQMRIGHASTEFVPGADAPAAALAGVTSDAHFPNDPLLLPQLWHYNMVDAPRAWRSTIGSNDIVVAVVDDGIRFDHPSIAANLTDDGYNFVTGGDWLEADEPVCSGGTTRLREAGYGPDPTAPDDLSWTGSCWRRSTLGNHGLHVAGTIGAPGNDGIGVTGLNWRVRIRPVRVLGTAGFGFAFDIAQGILYAAGLPASDGGTGTITAPSSARIINLSLGSGAPSPVMQSAVGAANQAGSLVVAAMGNSQSSAPMYPAAFADVVAVAALAPDLQLASYTNVGTNVSLSAPGGNARSSNTSGVVSTTWNFVTGSPSYAYYVGTSMAAPHVAGVAALVLAASPGLSRAQLRARLETTAVPLGAPGRDERFGWGVVNAYRAVRNLTAPSHPVFVRLHDAITGDTVRTVALGPSGSFSFPRLREGSYHVVAGEAETAAERVALPGMRYGWFGDGRGPAPIVVSATQTSRVNIAVRAGTPREAKPNGNRDTANRLLVGGYVMGHITATHREAFFEVPVPTDGRYVFETSGVIGTCAYGIELDTYLTLYAPDGSIVAQNDDFVMPGSAFCSRIEVQLAPGLYHVRVTGSSRQPRGQFVLRAGR
jgi:subtilisin family serine protease